jgi:excinuclease UvrABC nuclease subunit
VKRKQADDPCRAVCFFEATTTIMASWAKQFDGQLELHPPLGVEHLSAVPAKRGVCLLLAEGEQPLLLLTAADIRSRLCGRLQGPPPDGEYKKTMDLRPVTAKVLWKLSDSHFETDLHYLGLARAIWPSGFAKLLAWKGGWFVHVDPVARFPRFAKGHDPFAPSGRRLGPFASAKDAQHFIDAMGDGFDLCRDYRCLMRAPHGQPCPYLQMGRCLGPCNGTISLEDYRAVVAKAADFAAGSREARIAELTAGMKKAAGALQFEKAAAIKTRLDRLSELDGTAYRLVSPVEEFRFILVHRGPSRKRAKVFLVDRGMVTTGMPVSYPPVEAELDAVLAQMRLITAKVELPGRNDLWRMALVANYLFGGNRLRGLALRWRGGMNAAELARGIEQSADALALKASVRGFASWQSAPSPPGSLTL